MQRREFFSSLTSSFRDNSKVESEMLLRPPYFNDEALFSQECGKCDAKCVDVCEENIIKIAEDKTPYLSFELSGCTFCDECAKACEFGVLSVEYRDNVNVDVAISIDSCLAWNGVMCFSCKDPCLENAIMFEGLFKPVIDMTKCTSCGFCVNRCPPLAIQVELKK